MAGIIKILYLSTKNARELLNHTITQQKKGRGDGPVRIPAVLVLL